MKGTKNMGGKFPGWAGWLLGAVAALGLIILGWFLFAPQPETEVISDSDVSTTAPAPDVAEPEAEPEAPATPEDEPTAPMPETPAPNAPVPDAPAAEPAAPVEEAPAAEAEEEAQAMLPRFDLVRISPDGDAVVAGQAEPGADISVLVDGAEVFSTKSDNAANFVAQFDLDQSPRERVMTLEATMADGTVLTSQENVIIQPAVMVALADEPEQPELTEGTGDLPAAPEADQAAPPPNPSSPGDVVAPETSEEGAEATKPEPPEVVEPEVENPEAPATEEPTVLAEAQPAAPRVLLAGPDGVTVLQDESPAAQLSIDSISYDDQGEVALAGRGKGQDRLQIYLDNTPLRTAEVGDDGQWHAPLPDVESGVYTLRVDAVGPDGDVTSRVETPFKREEPEQLAAAGQEALASGAPISAITVQPGHTLWAIARGRYGEGVRYVTIYNANRDQIRDPDLIYPGQVFTLPDMVDETGE
jgi:nucleoid-associated protein YgaU